MARILDRRQSTIVQVGEEEIELVESEEEAPLLLDERLVDILARSLEYWYWNRRNSKVPRNQTLETISCTKLETRDAVKEVDTEGLPLRRTRDSSEDMLALQESMNELRLEMEHATFMDDPVKRLKIQALLQRVEETITLGQISVGETNPLNETRNVAADGGAKNFDRSSMDAAAAAATVDQAHGASKDHSTTPAPNTLLDHLRRASVAVAGGALTAAGVALTPCPFVPSTLVTYLGLLLLSTEFESAQRALDAVRDPIDRLLLASSGSEEVPASSPEAEPVR